MMSDRLLFNLPFAMITVALGLLCGLINAMVQRRTTASLIGLYGCIAAGIGGGVYFLLT